LATGSAGFSVAGTAVAVAATGIDVAATGLAVGAAGSPLPQATIAMDSATPRRPIANNLNFLRTWNIVMSFRHLDLA
jgi:hypothetical protein